MVKQIISRTNRTKKSNKPPHPSRGSKSAKKRYRDLILEFIHHNPGAHYYEIKTKLGIANGTLSYNLGQLLEQGLIIESKTYKGKRPKRQFYPAEDDSKDFPKFNKKEGVLLKLIIEQPGITQKEIITATKYPQSTVSRLLKKLRTSGLISSDYDDIDGRKRYWVLSDIKDAKSAKEGKPPVIHII